MKTLFLLFLTCYLFIIPAMAGTTCQVYIDIQAYDPNTGNSKVTSGMTKPFKVTKLPHETAYPLEIISDTFENLGTVKVDTGILIGTSFGDIYQAHASLVIYGAQRYLGLSADVDSRVSIADQHFESNKQNEYEMTSVLLKCVKDV